MEKIGWTDRVENERVLERFGVERNILTYLLTYLLHGAESFLRS